MLVLVIGSSVINSHRPKYKIDAVISRNRRGRRSCQKKPDRNHRSRNLKLVKIKLELSLVSAMGSISPTKNHALVFGASGITGWAIVNAILNNYPSPETFHRITALTNRPLSHDAAQWPASDNLQVVYGLDLLRGDQAALESEMKQRVRDMQTVTHVYFFAYVMDMNAKKEIQVNVDLLRRAVTAVENLSPQLKFVVLPTGTKVGRTHP